MAAEPSTRPVQARFPFAVLRAEPSLETAGAGGDSGTSTRVGAGARAERRRAERRSEEAGLRTPAIGAEVESSPAGRASIGSPGSQDGTFQKTSRTRQAANALASTSHQPGRRRAEAPTRETLISRDARSPARLVGLSTRHQPELSREILIRRTSTTHPKALSTVPCAIDAMDSVALNRRSATIEALGTFFFVASLLVAAAYL